MLARGLHGLLHQPLQTPLHPVSITANTAGRYTPLFRCHLPVSFHCLLVISNKQWEEWHFAQPYLGSKWIFSFPWGPTILPLPSFEICLYKNPLLSLPHLPNISFSGNKQALLESRCLHLAIFIKSIFHNTKQHGFTASPIQQQHKTSTWWQHTYLNETFLGKE